MAKYILGDLHGYHQDYTRLLQNAGLCDDALNWSGGEDQLWLIGDLFDRGESGIRCVDITMNLQIQAEAAGGKVQCILGNHELMILCAYRFKDKVADANNNVVAQWQRWGGVASDLEQFTERHANWIENLPAMARVDQALLIHADAMLYLNFGFDIDSVNQGFKSLMQQDNLAQWQMALSEFAEHTAFSGLALTGTQRAKQILRLFGGDLLVHGHTPIPHANGSEPESVVAAWQYAGGSCVNVDGGIYLGSPGFLYQLPFTSEVST